MYLLIVPNISVISSKLPQTWGRTWNKNVYSRSCLMTILGHHHLLPKACLGAYTFLYACL